MKRRGFLKLIGVGATAPVIAPTPVAAFNSAPIMGGLANSDLVPDFVGDGIFTDTSKNENAVKRILQLNNLLSSSENYEEEEWTISRRRRAMAEIRINSIRSMSQTYKAIVLEREIFHIERASAKRGWIKELFNLENPDG